MSLAKHAINMQAGLTAGEIAARLYPGSTYDHGLPQLFVDRMRRRGFDPVGRVVWLYPDGDLFGVPAPLDIEAYVELLRGQNHG